MSRNRGRTGALGRLYSRTVGAIQLLYALFFAWMAVGLLCIVVQHEGTFKGVYLPPVNLSRLGYGAIAALLFLFALIAGCGLIALRRWARYWEVAYLALLFALVATEAATDVWRARDLALVCAVLVLPYLPFLFVSPPPHDKDTSMT